MQRYALAVPEPADFDAFWQATPRQAAAADVLVDVRPVDAGLSQVGTWGAGSGPPAAVDRSIHVYPFNPGLGVSLDRDALARLHEQYLRCWLRNRDHTSHMQRIDPTYRKVSPRW